MLIHTFYVTMSNTARMHIIGGGKQTNKNKNIKINSVALEKYNHLNNVILFPVKGYRSNLICYSTVCFLKASTSTLSNLV